MTFEKWYSIYRNEADVYCKELSTVEVSPSSWEQDRKVILNFVKAVDEATEVYNMESKRK